LFEHSEGAAVVALAEGEFDCVEGEEEAHVEVEELDGLELGEDVFDCYFVVAGIVRGVEGEGRALWCSPADLSS
jgi:hypothetical protein